jgi:putative FmdB family regulatory protein
MPLYEYACADCGGRLERRQRFSEAPLRECPTCGGVLSRLIQPVGIIFKGSGWYITDHRSDKAATKAGDGESAKSETSKDTAKKSDSTKAAASATA